MVVIWNAGGYKSVGFCSAGFTNVMVEEFGRFTGRVTVMELPALPNLQELTYGKMSIVGLRFFQGSVVFSRNRSTQPASN